MKMNFKRLALLCILAASSLNFNISANTANTDIKDMAATVKRIEEAALAKDSITQENKAALLKELDALEANLNKKWYLQVGVGIVTAAATAWSLNKLYDIHYKIPKMLNRLKFLGYKRDSHSNRYHGKYQYASDPSASYTRRIDDYIIKLSNSYPDEVNFLGEPYNNAQDFYIKRIEYSLNPFGYKRLIINLIPVMLIAFKDKLASGVKNIFGGYKKDLEKIKQIRELINSVKTV